MTDVRRRRKSNQSCGSDDLSDSYEDLNATKGTQSSEQTDGHQDSECDIYASDSEFESQDGAQRESGDGQEEDKPQKKLDDDEDRRNPQYIPKRGTFYEHDDRTADEVADTKAEVPSEREPKEKKVWKDKEDRWDHDRYNDEEQAPKSHEELIAVYGYDIRNEEGPPRARRRRRYGRGPNKYTRNWEDEDAYGKTGGNTNSGKPHRRFNRTGEEFPALGPNKEATGQVEEPVISSAWYSSKSKSQSKVQNFPPLQSQTNSLKTKTSGSPQTNENKAPNEPTNPAWKKDAKHASQNQNSNGSNGPGGDADKMSNAKPSPRDSNKRNVQESVGLTGNRTRGRGFKANANSTPVSNRMAENKPKGHGSGPITTDSRRNNITEDDEEPHTHDSKHNANDNVQYHQSARHNKNFYNQSNNQQRTSNMPPRMHQQSHPQPQQQQQQQQQQPQSHQQPLQQQQQQDGSSTRPKRYSSLRQRPTISEGPAQQTYPTQHNQHGQHAQHTQHGQHGQHGYFPPQAGNSRGVLDSQGYAQGHFEQSAPVAAAVGATAAPMAGQPVIPLPPSGQAASYAPPPFLVPPPQFIPPQTAPPSIINYVPGPNGPAFPANFQGYQGYSPPVQPQRPPQPQELYQPQGCTYYSPAQQQQQQQQSAPLRRPKAAIPILPPPDNQHQTSRGRGRSTQQLQNNQAGSTQNSDQENKSNAVEGDKKTVPEQFDNIQEEQLEQAEQTSKNDELSALTETVVEKEDENVKNDNVNVVVNAENTTNEDLYEDDVKHTSETDFKEDNTPTTVKSTEILINQTETQLSKIDITASESVAVEEAVA